MMMRRIERGQRLKGRRQSIAEAARASSRLWSADDRGEIKLLNGRYVDFQFIPHTHNCYSIAIVTSGVLEFDYRGSVESAVAGMVSIVEPGEVHNGRAGVGDEWTYRNFFVGSEMMRRIASRLGCGSDQPYFSTPSIEDPELIEDGQPLCDTAHACGFADQSHLTRRFRQVMGVTPGQYASS